MVVVVVVMSTPVSDSGVVLMFLFRKMEEKLGGFVEYVCMYRFGCTGRR